MLWNLTFDPSWISKLGLQTSSSTRFGWKGQLSRYWLLKKESSGHRWYLPDWWPSQLHTPATIVRDPHLSCWFYKFRGRYLTFKKNDEGRIRWKVFTIMHNTWYLRNFVGEICSTYLRIDIVERIVCPVTSNKFPAGL